MELTPEKLLKALLETTLENLKAVEHFKSEPMEILNWRQDSESWSILECIEHLNKYGGFYIPEIKNKIETSKYVSSELFRSNWLGRYFSKMVSYNENSSKMKTFKSMNPLNSKLTIQTLEKFKSQQYQIIELLNKSKNVDLDKTKTAISISKLIKLRLGDSLRVLVYHNERHVKQAEKVLGKACR